MTDETGSRKKSCSKNCSRCQKASRRNHDVIASYPEQTATDITVDPEKPREYCGLVGVFGSSNATPLVYEALLALQHRGQEGAGIAITRGYQIICNKGLGLLDKAISRETVGNMASTMAIGHVRYSTTGSEKLQNVQPLIGDCCDSTWAIAHNGSIINAAELRQDYQARGALFQTGVDSEILLHLLADPLNLQSDRRIEDALEKLAGSFSLLLMTPDRLIAVRDPRGNKPLSLGFISPKPTNSLDLGLSGRRPQIEPMISTPQEWIVASETCALDRVGATFVRDLEPGEVLYIEKSGLRSTQLASRGKLAQCLFELIYFARPDSEVFGHSVYQFRYDLGKRLAKEKPIDADFVAPIPDSGLASALGYANQSKLSFNLAFVRNNYVGRSFISPSKSQRSRAVERKLAPIKATVEGKRIVLVDDSLVRGNTCQKRIRALREAGVKEVHLRISCPPVCHPCFYGIDFPSRAELAAANYTIEEIGRQIGADSLGYLSLEGMLGTVNNPNNFCLACFNGDYPEGRGCCHKEALESENYAKA